MELDNVIRYLITETVLKLKDLRQVFVGRLFYPLYAEFVHERRRELFSSFIGIGVHRRGKPEIRVYAPVSFLFYFGDGPLEQLFIRLPSLLPFGGLFHHHLVEVLRLYPFFAFVLAYHKVTVRLQEIPYPFHYFRLAQVYLVKHQPLAFFHRVQKYPLSPFELKAALEHGLGYSAYPVPVPVLDGGLRYLDGFRERHLLAAHKAYRADDLFRFFGVLFLSAGHGAQKKARGFLPGKLPDQRFVPADEFQFIRLAVEVEPPEIVVGEARQGPYQRGLADARFSDKKKRVAKLQRLGRFFDVLYGLEYRHEFGGLFIRNVRFVFLPVVHGQSGVQDTDLSVFAAEEPAELKVFCLFQAFYYRFVGAAVKKVLKDYLNAPLLAVRLHQGRKVKLPELLHEELPVFLLFHPVAVDVIRALYERLGDTHGALIMFYELGPLSPVAPCEFVRLALVLSEGLFLAKKGHSPVEHDHLDGCGLLFIVG